MSRFPSIQSFFPKSPVSPYKATFKPGDGFTPAEAQSSSSSSPTWIPKGLPYIPKSIGSLKTGPSRISFTGRIVNYREQETGTKSATAAKSLLRLALKDDSGIIEVKFWLSTPPGTNNNTVYLGRLCTIHTTFIAGLDPASFATNAATVPCFVSLSDNDPGCHIEFQEENDKNIDVYKEPLGFHVNQELEGLMPLKTFINGGADVPGARFVVCVRSIGAKKRVSFKDGRSAEKIEVGIFDDTSDGTLILWGTMICSASSWKPSETILLITSPTLKLWSNKAQLTIAKTSIIEIDPSMRDAKWLRDYAQKMLKKPTICQPFPGNDVFDWEEELNGNMRILYTFADIDMFSREVPMGQCVGYLSVVIVEMNIISLYKRNMLLCGTCCGLSIFSNTLENICKNCEKPMSPFTPNPRIIGLLADETGCIPGSRVLFSNQAWTNIFGRSVKEFVQETSAEVMQYLEHRLLFMRVTLMFGWDAEVGRVAVWDVTV